MQGPLSFTRKETNYTETRISTSQKEYETKSSHSFGERGTWVSPKPQYHFEEITNNRAADYFSCQKVILRRIVQHFRKHMSHPSRHPALEYMRKNKSPHLPYPTHFAPLFPTDWLSFRKPSKTKLIQLDTGKF